MRRWLRGRWTARAPRERRLVLVMASLLAALLYAALAWTGEQSRPALREGVARLRAQDRLMDQQVQEYEQLRALPRAPASTTALHQLVGIGLGGTTMAGSLVRVEADGADRAVVVFGAVAFADWLDWVSALEAQHIRVESVRLEALAVPGVVSVTATLARTPAP